MLHRSCFCFCFLAILVSASGLWAEGIATRTSQGLQVLYDFAENKGPFVRDRSKVGPPLHLRISNAAGVRRSYGKLEVTGKTILRGGQSQSIRLGKAIQRTGAVTLETWITPKNTKQKGPARIVTLSKNGAARNLTLGQEGEAYDVRCRTNKTSGNGLPSLAAKKKSVKAELSHVVYTRGRTGVAKLYVNGMLSKATTIEGDLSNWRDDHRFALANEQSMDRQWLGTYHLIAVYNRELSLREVQRHFKIGPTAGEVVEEPEADPNEILFETKVAGILSKHCLECHDASNRKGKLDLSHKVAAFAGGRNGATIEPGDAKASLLWESVVTDEMPEDRTPLTAEEKAILKQWIDGGAKWTFEMIDPAVYAHGGEMGKQFVQRLTIPEYIETVWCAVGVDIAKEARELLPRDLRADGFSNTAYNLNVDLKHVETYAKLAEIIVGKMDLGSFVKRFTESRKFTDNDMAKLIEPMGKWLLRGPVTKQELFDYRGVSTSVAAAGGDFEEAAGYIVEAMLQAPRFIYRVENQLGDGTAWPVSEYELASRISYIVVGGPPDKELIEVAEWGDLYDDAAVRDQVQRLLGDMRAVDKSLLFAEEWLNLGRLRNLQPNREKFPNWDPALAEDMREETLAFFKHVVWEQGKPLANLFNAQVSYLTPRLAKHYGLQSVIFDSDATVLKRVDLSKEPSRGGLLTQGSILTVGGDEASMVTRGLFVMQDVLRGVVKDPPPGTDTTPVPSKPGMTQRMVAEERISNPSCGGCHAKFEPLSFGLEKYNGLGAYHEHDEHGNALREDGEILFPGQREPVTYDSALELMDLLASSKRVEQSIIWKLVQFALGRPLGAEDARSVEKIHADAKSAGGITYQNILSAIITSDLVRTTRTEALQ